MTKYVNELNTQMLLVMWISAEEKIQNSALVRSRGAQLFSTKKLARLNNGTRERELKLSASQLNKLVLKDSPHI